MCSRARAIGKLNVTMDDGAVNITMKSVVGSQGREGLLNPRVGSWWMAIVSVSFPSS